MDKDEKSKGPWLHTVPGILTAVAGTITAATGLIVALHQAGLFGVTPKDLPRQEAQELSVSPSPPVSVEKMGLPKDTQRSVSIATTPQPERLSLNSVQQPVSNASAPSNKRSSPITADNLATKVHDELWDWTVFVQGSDDVLDEVRCVEYTLHPTFPDPIQTVCQRGNEKRAFALSGSAWGTFEVRIRVIMNNGAEQKLTHYLKF